MDPEVLLTSADDNGHRSIVDFADGSRTKVGPPEGEIGSAYSGELLFTRFDDGRVFETRDLVTRDYEEMLHRDGKAKTLEQVLTLPLRAAEHSIEPAQGDSGEAEFCREALQRPANAGGMTTPLDLVVGQMTSACLYRRAYFEKVFAIDEGKVVYRKLAFRPARTCALLRDKDDFSFAGFKQRFLKSDDTVDVTIPPQKAFVYIYGTHRDPLNGISDLATAHSIYESKQKVRFLWYSFLENQNIPKGIAKHSKPDTDEQDDFAKRVASLKGGGVVGIGPDQDVSPFESGGQGAAEFREAMNYLSAEMAGSVLAAFTELPTDGRGSYALSRDQTDFFLMSRIAVLSEMAAALTSWVLADLCLWNFGTSAAVPTFAFKPPESDAIEQSVGLLQALATAAGPGPLPMQFIDLLTEKVASHLGLDTDVVHKAIADRMQNAGGPSEQLRAGIDAATQLVANAQVGASAA